MSFVFIAQKNPVYLVHLLAEWNLKALEIVNIKTGISNIWKISKYIIYSFGQYLWMYWTMGIKTFMALWISKKGVKHAAFLKLTWQQTLMFGWGWKMLYSSQGFCSQNRGICSRNSNPMGRMTCKYLEEGYKKGLYTPLRKQKNLDPCIESIFQITVLRIDIFHPPNINVSTVKFENCRTLLSSFGDPQGH